ncbi:MAG: hypothetical protein IKL82_06150 [Clostridia bacterium]|nr:hypothetical protein [Clostridia bacterium]
MKYLCYYDKNQNEGRNYVLAATNKIDYIAEVLAKNIEPVEIVSFSCSSNKGNFNERYETLKDGITLRLFKAKKRKNVFQKIIATVYSFFAPLFYLLKNVKKGEKIIVYHSLSNMKVIRIAKAIKKFKLILEVEEIYGDVTNNQKTVKNEFDYFSISDGYIFPTILLNEKINHQNKPYAIVHGTYNVQPELSKKFADGKIHCVYAGTFDMRKGGAILAVKSCEYLSSNYHVHIIGFGSENDKNLLLMEIERINALGKCIVTYDGLYDGEDYIKFIQSCHIGLSTQNSNAKFNDSSFPSKVLSYLANGLRVVTAKIKVLETSEINNLLYYYNDSVPKNIANAIATVDLKSEYDSRKELKCLNNEFIASLSEVLLDDNFI